MPAGGEMDRLIAEKVMGYTVYHYDKDHPNNCYYMLMDADFDPVLFTGNYRDSEKKTEEEAWNDCPEFSTDILAAWEVVKKLGELGFTVIIEWKGSDRVYAGTAEVTLVKRIYTEGHGVGTLPEAICQAALMAIA